MATTFDALMSRAPRSSMTTCTAVRGQVQLRKLSRRGDISRNKDKSYPWPLIQEEHRALKAAADRNRGVPVEGTPSYEEARARHEVTKAGIAAAEARPAVAQRPLMYPVEQCLTLRTPKPLERLAWGVLLHTALGVCAAEAQAAGQDGSGVCGDVADWGHDGLGRGVADGSGWLGGRREGRAGVPRSFHRRDGVGHGALRRPGGCAAA